MQTNGCFELWCKLNDEDNSCITKSEKAAEGTLCGDGTNFVSYSLFFFNFYFQIIIKFLSGV